jgi:hypothetical protein
MPTDLFRNLQLLDPRFDEPGGYDEGWAIPQELAVVT